MHRQRSSEASQGKRKAPPSKSEYHQGRRDHPFELRPTCVVSETEEMGTVTVMVVPWELESRPRVPPNSFTRSRMPANPNPVSVPVLLKCCRTCAGIPRP